MLIGILTTACGVVLAGTILLAAITLVVQVRACWRIGLLRRQHAEDTDRFIARVRAEQRYHRASIANLRRTAEAYHVHLPEPPQAQDGGQNTREGA